MEFRPYDPEKDKDAAHRIWREIGWIKEANEVEAMDIGLASTRVLVAELEGSAECLVSTFSGAIRYLDEDLPFGIVGAVSTSHIARKQRLAGRLTALGVASEVAEGALVCGLGMFEQGYYDKLGFGTLPYNYWTAFDPADLLVDVKARVPRRISADDWQAVHASRVSRLRGHGSCSILLPEMTRAAMVATKNGFGFGYYEGRELTHHIWIRTDHMEHGPYEVLWTAWRNGDQFLELLALLKNLGDQVHLVRLDEPQGIQLQDLLRQPMKHRTVTKGSKFANEVSCCAHSQARICDLPWCMEKTHLSCGTVRFNLQLDDPIETLLDDEASWRGVSGEYVVALGPESNAKSGSDPSLPTLKASVGAFTRMWLGVQPSSGLAVTDKLFGSSELLRELDRALILPRPQLGWDI